MRYAPYWDLKPLPSQSLPNICHDQILYKKQHLKHPSSNDSFSNVDEDKFLQQHVPPHEFRMSISARKIFEVRSSGESEGGRDFPGFA